MDDKKIIFFSLKGCSKCEQLKPVFEKVAAELNMPYEAYVLPEAPREIKKLVYTYNIEVFPTILSINGDNVKKIDGLKTENALREFLRQ
ncbi:MAG: thioredoxin family protein [Candidatus Goldbacteria bacterium]|nr:thioredoxin family protein [Candidatus Goldiibacteriota bacterium]